MSIIVCPANCNVLPDVHFDLCDIEYHFGEISKIYVTSAIGADFTNWDQLAEWTPRLADTGGDEDSIRTILCLGDYPAPEVTEIPTSGDNYAYGFGKYKIVFEVDHTNTYNYDFLRYMRCPNKYKVMFETADGMLYGRNTWLLGTFHGSNVIPRGRNELNKYMYEFRWTDTKEPERCISPLF